MKKRKIRFDVFLLVRRSPDISPNFVEVYGVFSTLEAAKQSRQLLWDEKLQVEVQTYFLQA